MFQTDKFEYYPMRKPVRIQPDSPVYVYGYGLAVQRSSGAAFVQMRLVNRWDTTIHSVFLHITGKDDAGDILYKLRYVPLIECGGQPHRDFGEEQVIFLPQGKVHSLDIEVEDVLFTDGMIWRSQSGQRLLTAQQAGWVTCSCGMKNPGEAQFCAYCRQPIGHTDAETGDMVPPFLRQNMKPLTRPAVPATEATEIPSPKENTPASEPPAIPVVQSSAVEEELPAPAIEDTEAETHVAEQDRDGQEGVEQEIEPESADSSLRELEELLYPFGAWIEQSERDRQQVMEDPVDAIVLQPSRAPAEPEDLSSLEEELSKSAPKVNEPAVPDIGFPIDMMRETGMILEELQRRIQAHQNGEPIPTEIKQEPAVQEPEEDNDGDKKSRGAGFWIIMILILILLAFAGFFGVLYWKGYFG